MSDQFVTQIMPNESPSLTAYPYTRQLLNTHVSNIVQKKNIRPRRKKEKKKVKEPIEEFRLISIRVLVWISREEVHTILTQKARDHVSIARKQTALSHQSPILDFIRNRKEETYTRHGSKRSKKTHRSLLHQKYLEKEITRFSEFATRDTVKVQPEPCENHSHQASQSSHLIQSQQQRQHSRQAQRYFEL
jgi:hypothetical protein